MKATMRKASAVLLSIVVTFFLSACSSLPFMGEDEPAINLPRQTQGSNASNAMQNEIEDFKSMKPSLSRLVALESDLSFLLEEMSRFNEQNPVMFDTADTPAPNNPNQSKSTVVFSADGKKEIASEKIVDGWAEGAGTMADKWNNDAREMNTVGMSLRKRPSSLSASGTSSSQGVNQAKFETNNNVELGSADPIMELDNARQPTSIAAGQPTFLAGSPASEIKREPARSNSQVDMNKFSNMTNPRQIVGNINNCTKWKADKTKTYALHLASYKSRTAAESGWSQLDEKYADVWCDTEASLAKVVVKGTEYLSLRVGGYDSRDKVLSLCSVIKERGDYCAVSTATGERIQ